MTPATNTLKWLARYGGDVAASADDLARFGPEAAKVRALLSFLPTMSGDARELSGQAWIHSPNAAQEAAWDVVDAAARGEWRSDGLPRALLNTRNAVKKSPGLLPLSFNAMEDAAAGQVTSRLIDPQTYRTLTNPLATGRAFDVVRRREPENFLDVARGLGERGLVQQPMDVLGARTLARAADPEREALMEVIDAIVGNTGYADSYADTGYDSLTDLIESARLLG
jgi:hypothetical protein